MKKMPKNAQNFYCEICDFTCSKKSNYENHLRTAKHRNRTISNDFAPKNAEYFCECGKRYTARNSLWYHKKKCTYKDSNMVSNTISNTISNTVSKDTEKVDLCKELLPLMKEMMIGIAPVLQPNTTINNQNFNINFFLNEQCKDAMNMTEFIESIQLTLEDMTKIGKQGQTVGMSNVLIDKLNDLDIFKRPVHCSDVKKEIIYVKDEDKWEEENRGRPKLKNALDQITKKSIQVLPSMSQDPDDYVQTVNELLKEPREDKKIISKVAKEMHVE